MVQEPFPWIPKPQAESSAEPKNHQIEKSFWIKHRDRMSFGAILVLLILGFKIVVPSRKTTNTLPNERTAEVNTLSALMLMIPTAKGNPILVETVKLVEMKIGSLTKTQRLNLLREDDLQKLNGRLLAKRDLPSSRPLLWTDISIKNDPATNPSKPKLILSEE